MIRTMVLLPLAVVLALLISFCLKASAIAAPRNQESEEGASLKDVVPGVVVVKFKRAITVQRGPVKVGRDSLSTALSQHGVISIAHAFPTFIPLNDIQVASGRIDLSQIHFASIPPALNPREVASQLARMPQVEYAEPKYSSYLCDIPNDSDYSTWQQVYFDRMNVPAGWALQKGSPGVVIATVDGGTNWRHPDLLPNIWINQAEDVNHNGVFDQFPAPGGDLNGLDDDGNGYVDDVVGWNFANESNNPRGFQPGNRDHGTETASAFGAATGNGRGMAGTSWNCTVMPVCAADPLHDNEIRYGFEGITYAFMNGARVINCSWVRRSSFSQMEQDVITAATQSGALIVAAAGNDGENFAEKDFYPAAYQHVLSVGATADTSDALLSDSNYGTNVCVFAPGWYIRVSLDDGSYGTASGTSMSSPLVAGLAGLLVSAHPDWTPDQIAGQIRLTGDPIDGSNPGLAGSLGHGRVNFGRALSEMHASLEIVSSSLLTSTGRAYILQGDTLVLSTVVKNTQGTPAQGLTFAARSTDPALQPLQGSTTIAELDSGQEASLPDFRFKVGDLSSERDVIVKLEWVYNMNDKDARTFRVHAFSSKGFWYTQTSLASSYLYSVKAVDSNIVWTAGGRFPSPYSPLVLRTTDGGTTWSDVTSNLPTPGPPPPKSAWDAKLCITAIDADRAWIANYDGRIYATTDGGSSWSQQMYPGRQCWSMDGIWFFDDSHGYALGDADIRGKQYVVLETNDGGITWAHLLNEPVGTGDELAFSNSFSYTDPDHIWFGTDYKVWRTTDGGGTWSYGRSDGRALSVSFRDNSTGLVGLTSRVARSLDGGATWANVGGLVIYENRLCYAPGSRLAWLVGTNGGPYVTDNDGLTWSQQPTSPFRGNPTHISFADPRHGWFITDLGEILCYRPPGITGVEPHPALFLPGQYTLHQNYPNPFNPSTTIKYELPSACHVTLTLYDVLGREVAALVNEQKRAGVYTVEFDAGGLAGGVYFYRMKTDDFVLTKKLVVVK
jgi:subtilisin family serine protease/photosystem II stability/assembly factor-like uncharacterized protein